MVYLSAIQDLAEQLGRLLDGRADLDPDLFAERVGELGTLLSLEENRRWVTAKSFTKPTILSY